MAKATTRRKAAGKKAAPRKSSAKASVKRGVKRATAKRVTAKRVAAKAAPKKQAARAAASSKRPAAKKAAPALRAAAKTAPARRKTATRRAATTAKAVRKLVSRAAPQTFAVSHLKEADFQTAGLRPYAQYRDLGVALATGGLCQAHVIRLVPPCTDEVRKRHAHDTELQLIYVLQGWVKNEFEGHGAQMMSKGSCWVQPPGIPHTVLDYSADCELLEIVVPADFKTADL